MFINQSIRENFKPTVFIIIVLILLAISAYPQQRLGGKVVEVLDGKTVSIELFSGGKITAELQHIEVPESEQQLHQTVIEHLQTLVLAKNVEFRPLRIINARTIGQVLLNGVDVSQQMIRDGAAWYSAAEKTGQNAGESETYQSNEEQAKSEKRGVWSIEGLKPAWQIRAEAEENRKIQAKLALATPAKSAFVEEMQKKQKPAPRRQFDTESQLFAVSGENIKMPANIKNVGGLLVGYDESAKLGIITTPLFKLNVAENDGSQAVAIQIAYLYFDGDINKGRQNVYLVGVESESRDFKFLKQNDLVITVDGQKINVGKAKRFERKGEFSVKEGLVYKINKSVIAKIAKAQEASVKVGIYSWKLNSGIQMLLHNMTQTVE
jgi:endonuclease YncB( thermonuclease family)